MNFFSYFIENFKLQPSFIIHKLAIADHVNKIKTGKRNGEWYKSLNLIAIRGKNTPTPNIFFIVKFV